MSAGRRAGETYRRVGVSPGRAPARSAAARPRLTSGPAPPTVVVLRRVRRRTSNERATPVAQERNPTTPTADTPIRRHVSPQRRSADTPIRRYADTFLPLRRPADPPIRRHVPIQARYYVSSRQYQITDVLKVIIKPGCSLAVFRISDSHVGWDLQVG